MPQDNKIKIRRGINSSLPAANTEVGELRYSTDTKELYIDDGTNNVKIGGNPLGFPVSTATQTALNLKANLESPALTGTPTAPTASAGTNTTQIATTAFTLANRGDRYLTTSTDSHSLTTGSKTFTVQSGLSYTATQDITIVADADPVNKHMHGVVTSYSGTTLVVDIQTVNESGGPYTAWTINVGGLLSSEGALYSANNLSDVANTATALTNLGGVPTSRTISSGNGLTGGGDLTANRTLSVSYGSATPSALGTASAGASNDVSRADHTHSAEVSDSAFRVLGSTDATKKVAFEVDTNVPSGQTVTLTAPSSSGTLALAGDAPAAHASSHYSVGSDPLDTGSFQSILGNNNLGEDINYLDGVVSGLGTAATADLNAISDADLRIVGSTDATKKIAIEVDTNVPTNTVVTLTAPSSGGTIARTSDIPSTFAASAITSGVFDNARINFAAPDAIGSTTRNSGAFTTLNATNGTLTASAPVLDLSQTWNNAAVTFTGLRFNVTNTASAAASLLADFQVGGTTQFAIRRNGNFNFPSQTNFFFSGNATPVLFDGTGTPSPSIVVPALGADGNLTLFTGRTGSGDMILRLVGGSLEQRNAANPQTFRLYSTYSSATSFERLNIIAQSAASVIIGTEKGSGGGSARGLELRTDNVARLTFGASGTITLNTTLAADAQNISTDTTTGTKIGTGTTQKIGFFNATPVAQRAAIADATDAATTQARLNDLLAAMRSLGLIAT